jgi:cell division protease FtsH
MGALGYVMHVPEEEKYLNTEAELRDMLVGLLAGRAAEEIVFDTVTTGASNDIEKATSIAKSMITQYGMSKKFGLIGLATVENRYLDGSAHLNCSDATAAEIDTEVVNLLKESYEKALELLRENRELMDKLAEFLIEKETITGKEFMQIFRKEKGLPEPEEKDEKKDNEKSEAEGKEEEKELEATEQTSAVDVTVTDETTTAKEQEEVSKEEASAEPAQEPEKEETSEENAEENPQTEDTPKDGSVGRFSNGRI